MSKSSSRWSRGSAQRDGDGAGIRRTYFYNSQSFGPDPGTHQPTRIVVEDTEDGAGAAVGRTVYSINEQRQYLRRVIIDDPTAQSPGYWIWSRKMNSSVLPDELRLPSAHTLVDTATELKSFLGAGTELDDSTYVNDSSGLIYVYTYANSVYRTSTKAKEGENGTAYFLSATDYGDGTDDKPKHLPIATYTYSTQTTTKTSGDKTAIAYTFWDTADRIVKTRTDTLPAVPTGENGSGTATTLKQYFDDDGRRRWVKDGEGHITYIAQHPDTGGAAYVMTDVETDDLPTDITAGAVGEDSAGRIDAARSGWRGSIGLHRRSRMKRSQRSARM